MKGYNKFQELINADTRFTAKPVEYGLVKLGIAAARQSLPLRLLHMSIALTSDNLPLTLENKQSLMVFMTLIHT